MTQQDLAERVEASAGRPNYPLLMIHAEVASGKATIRSLGALYMVALASVQIGAEPADYWQAINNTIAVHLGGTTPGDRLRKLDKVKKIGWDLYEGVCAIQREEGLPR